MFASKSFFLVLVSICHIWLVNCVDDEKFSLVFAIDDTGSMMDDIDQVKTQVDSIFENALNSNSSRTEDFVIVTFNDPGSLHRTTTKDKATFKKALADIYVNGGGDCPELAMEGLELALQHSRNRSLVYLFTDADAKDFEKYESVKSLAYQKNCRLHFILTGTCRYYYDRTRTPNKNSNNEPGHRVYFDLAEATGGQVFSQFKEEVGAILGHATASISRGYSKVLASEVIRGPEVSEYEVPAFERYGAAGHRHKPSSYSAYPSRAAHYASELKYAPPTTIRPGIAIAPYHFQVSEGVKELLVSVSGFHPTVELTGPDGTAPKTEDVATTSGSKIIRILEAKPGQYTAKVTSLGRTSIVVSGNDVPKAEV